jgi:hypothetical protein
MSTIPSIRLPFLVACAAIASIYVMPAFAGDAKDTEKVAVKEPAEATAAQRPEYEPLHPQQARMKACNVEAAKKDLHGDERKAFMSNCLKKQH